MRKLSIPAQIFCAFHPTPPKVFGALAVTVLLLTGCAAMAERPPLQAQPRCDYEGPSGICVRVDPDARRFDLAALEAAYARAKRDVESRYQLNLANVGGPTVRVVSFATYARSHSTSIRLDGDTGGDFGWTAFRTGEIKITGPAVMRHEALHYLLWRAGYPNDLNAAHEHPAFDEYRDGRWLPKRPRPPVPATASQQTQAVPASLSTPPAGPELLKTTAP